MDDVRETSGDSAAEMIASMPDDELENLAWAAGEYIAQHHAHLEALSHLVDD